MRYAHPASIACLLFSVHEVHPTLAGSDKLRVASGNLLPPVSSRLVVKKHSQATEVRIGIEADAVIIVTVPVVGSVIVVMPALSLWFVFVVHFFVDMFVVCAAAVTVGMINAMTVIMVAAAVFHLVMRLAAILPVLSTPAMATVSSVSYQR